MLVFIQNLVQSIKRLFFRVNRFEKVIEVQDNPDKITRKLLVLITTGKGYKWLKFRCPCGCGTEVNLPLMKNRKPHWTVFNECKGIISVYPSIDLRPPGCGAHFWINKNRVKWAKPIRTGMTKDLSSGEERRLDLKI